jgi:hypothetical protein
MVAFNMIYFKLITLTLYESTALILSVLNSGQGLGQFNTFSCTYFQTSVTIERALHSI